eukprot:1161424-Pelagomonas_calceolata.AAC.4
MAARVKAQEQLCNVQLRDNRPRAWLESAALAASFEVLQTHLPGTGHRHDDCNKVPHQAIYTKLSDNRGLDKP